MPRIHKATAALLTTGWLLLLIASPALAQSDRPLAPGEPAQSAAQRTKRNRDRWAKLSPEARRAYVERFRRLQALSPEGREQVIDRARRYRALPRGRKAALKSERAGLRRRMRAQFKKLSPDERAALRRLPAAERRRALRNLVARDTLARHRVELERLPARARRELAALSPEAQLRRVMQHVKRRRKRKLAAFVRTLPRAQRMELRALERPARQARLRELLRARAAKRRR